MKKLIAGIALIGMSTQVAYASQARLIALGLDELDNEGSYYIQDSRNIFLNAAAVNDYADMAIVEFGSTGRATSASAGMQTNATVDQDDKAKAQGGFLKKSGNFVYGAYLGNESNTSSFLRVASTSNAAALNNPGGGGTNGALGKMMPTSDNQLDLFLGSTLSNGVKWGANLVYLKNEDQTIKQEDKAGAVRLGLSSRNWDVHANISFMNQSENTIEAAPGGVGGATENVKQEFDGKLGMHLGGSYQVNKFRIFGYYKTFKWDQKDSYSGYGAWAPAAQAQIGKQGTSEGKFDTYLVGVGRIDEVNSNGKIFTNLSVKKTDVEVKLAKNVEVNNLIVPLTFGYEHQATTWLALRGSFTQNIIGKKDNKNFNSANVVAKNLVEGVYGTEGKGTIQNSTRVNAGATLTFGKLTVDGVIGTTAVSRTGAADTQSRTQSGTLALDNLMTRVAATYMF